jgi:bisphosphoglycerate-dependent phosphoglycerate mutase
MTLDGLAANDIAEVEIATGDILIYDLSSRTTVESKRIISAGLSTEPKPAVSSDS